MDKQELVGGESECVDKRPSLRSHQGSGCGRLAMQSSLLLTGSVLLLICLSWASRQSVGQPPPVAPMYSPNPRGPAILYPAEGEVLLDLPPQSLLVNSPACLDDIEQPLLMVIMVVSHPAHKALRAAHRAHASAKDLRALGARRVFLLADASQSQVRYPSVERKDVLKEAIENRDLVVGPFIDHYRNLTYKHALALAWPNRYCTQAQYIVKADDDIMIDIWGLAQLLVRGLLPDPTGTLKSAAQYPGKSKLTSQGMWAAGYVQQGLVPQRGHGKWAVTPKEYSGGRYPLFLAGWAYVITQPASKAILKVTQRLPYFWIDDIHMTGTAAGLAGVRRYALNHLYTLDGLVGRCCLNATHSTASSNSSNSAPMCGLLVAPSDKDPDLLGAWLMKSKMCHTTKAQCKSTSTHSCPHSNLGGRMVGSVIPIK